VLIALVIVLSAALLTRSDIETTVLKVPGTTFQKTDDGLISNLYSVEFVNKTFDEINLEVRIESPSTAILEKVGGKDVVVPKEGLVKNVYFVKIPRADITGRSSEIVLGVYRDGKVIETIKTRFVSPVGKASD
jgi:hypothetical protein